MARAILGQLGSVERRPRPRRRRERTGGRLAMFFGRRLRTAEALRSAYAVIVENRRFFRAKGLDW